MAAVGTCEMRAAVAPQILSSCIYAECETRTWRPLARNLRVSFYLMVVTN